MSERFRASMNWLHTWAGLVIGALLFAVFWMGTLSVFDREVDRWMLPETRRPATASVSLDNIVRTAVTGRDLTGLYRFGFQHPTDRAPTIEVFFNGKADMPSIQVDPTTGRTLAAEERTYGGSGFFFPFHYSLLMPRSLLWLGEWLVGLAAMAMMALCVSGVVIHRRIFADFFMLRFVRKAQRTMLDIHNVLGVIGLPFNFLISLTGLIIFASIYLPAIQATLYPNDRASFNKEARGFFSRERTGKSGELASLDAMAREASRRWGGDKPGFVNVWNPGDASAYVRMDRNHDNHIAMDGSTIIFDGATGTVLQGPHPAPPIVKASRFLEGMHFTQFRHWTLRWLYFLFGLAGCVLIATGYLFWTQSRAKRHAKERVLGWGLVRGLSIAATAGIVLATAAFLVANRLLPDTAIVLGCPRADAEIWVFFTAWIASFVHAWLRPAAAWREQAWVIAVLALAAPVLNWLTTADTIPASLAAGQWGVAGVDMVLLAGGAIAVVAARRLTKLAPPQTTQPIPVPAE